MRFRYWSVVAVFLTGLSLVCLGLYYTLVSGDSQLGYELLLIGGAAWAVLLAVGMLYVARVRLKILRNASRY
jgi:hypothetical protein